MQITSYNWSATIRDKRNRDGLPAPSGEKFSEIVDLDSICDRGGGIEVAQIRLPCSKLHNQFDNRAETLYTFPWGLVHNVVQGNYPNWQTTMYFNSNSNQPEIAQDFEIYFGRLPHSSVQQIQLKHLSAGIIKQMKERQSQYDESPVLELMQGIADHERFQDRMMESYIHR